MAESPDREFTLEQIERFASWADESGLGEGVVLHAANSAGALDFRDSRLGRIRPGLAAYGYFPASHLESACDLRPALTLKSHLMQTKSVGKGESCGYGLTHRFAQATTLGLVPVGYADGYLRGLGNQAVMSIRGNEVPVRGTVAMDQTIVDLGNVPEAAVGDFVEIISADTSASNSVENLARLAGTIPYEILTRLGDRIERRLVP